MKRDRRRFCTKHGYRDHREAILALHRCVARAALGNGRRRETRAYECPRCGRWHLTSVAVKYSLVVTQGTSRYGDSHER